MSCTEAKGEHKDGIFQLTIPENNSLIFSYVENLKSASHVTVPGKTNCPFTQKDLGYVSVYCVMPSGW